MVSIDEVGLIRDFLGCASVEVTPGGASKIADFRDILREGTVVYVTFLPGSDFGDTIETVRVLKEQGMVAVPHFAARSIVSLGILRENLDRLQSVAEVGEALIIGGGVAEPLGDFSSSLELLQTGLFQEYGIRKLGIAGHPEGSPDISDSEIYSSLGAKRAYGLEHGLDLYIATQFCFSAGPIFAWERDLRLNHGNDLPIHIGIPGLATIKTLLRHAQACGIGPSMQFLVKQAKQVTRLLMVNEPDRLVRDLVVGIAGDVDCLIEMPHVYPLGGLVKSVDWLYGVVGGDFELDGEGGFRLKN